MRILLFIFSLAVLAGCSDFNNFYEERKADRKLKAGDEDIVAIVGSEEITKGELLEALSKLPYKQRKIYQSSHEKMNEYLEIYINQKVLYAEAIKRGINRRKEILEKTGNFEKTACNTNAGTGNIEQHQSQRE